MRIVIVGNALPDEDLSERIDSADRVLRFGVVKLPTLKQEHITYGYVR